MLLSCPDSLSGLFFALLGVYLFFTSFATKLHFFLGVFFHFIIGADRGDTKGEDCYQDVCILLNPNTMKLYRAEKLIELKPTTKNKLYVAITRAKGNVYFIDERIALKK